MKQLTENQIENFKLLASKSTSVEECGDEWNPCDISGGNFDDAYYVGYEDADIENARFILDLFEIEY
jgi:hypothetical protein